MNIISILIMMVAPIIMFMSNSSAVHTFFIVLVLLFGGALIVTNLRRSHEVQKILDENESFHTQTEEKQKASHLILHYTFHALPVHIEQIESVIKETGNAALSLGDHFSSLLDKVNETNNSSTHISKKVSEDINHEIESTQESISEIMTLLQFQDTTRQVLEHVQEDLAKITQDIHDLDILIDMDNIEESRKLEENIAKRYTMDSERKAFDKVTGQKVSPIDNAASEDDGITFL